MQDDRESAKSVNVCSRRARLQLSRGPSRLADQSVARKKLTCSVEGRSTVQSSRSRADFGRENKGIAGCFFAGSIVGSPLVNFDVGVVLPISLRALHRGNPAPDARVRACLQMSTRPDPLFGL